MKGLEENVALDKSSQSTFTKAVKNIQHLIKKGSVKVNNEVVKPGGKRRKKDPKPSDRGVVYLTHVPHGFYEDAMVSYFTQFGQVTGVKLVRSKKTGKSQGFAFIEFLHTEVAKVAAETMNNYLMFDRLIKAEYVPPEKQKRMVFSRGLNTNRITAETCQKSKNRKNFIKKKNRIMVLTNEEKAITQSKKTLADLKKKLEKEGITFNFEPVHDSPPVKTVVGRSRNDDYSEDGAPIISLDMSDPEIDFNAPPGTIVRPLKRESVKHKRGRRSKGAKKSPEKPTKSPPAKNITKTLSKVGKDVKQMTKLGLKSSDKKEVDSGVKKSKDKANMKSGKIAKLNFGFTVTPIKEKVDNTPKKLGTSSVKKEKGISYSGKGKGRRSSVKI